MSEKQDAKVFELRNSDPKKWTWSALDLKVFGIKDSHGGRSFVSYKRAQRAEKSTAKTKTAAPVKKADKVALKVTHRQLKPKSSPGITLPVVEHLISEAIVATPKRSHHKKKVAVSAPPEAVICGPAVTEVNGNVQKVN